jgi:hypothetical protein
MLHAEAACMASTSRSITEQGCIDYNTPRKDTGRLPMLHQVGLLLANMVMLLYTADCAQDASGRVLQPP